MAVARPLDLHSLAGPVVPDALIVSERRRIPAPRPIALALIVLGALAMLALFPPSAAFG